ncbi:TIGR02253 family HAD-type hydrolase [Candidatus Woesearchaeota archaeon]|nr:MAG: TIGR02253 family HAD-type hydrolase [Candidatus Woesearchaeota archaeon]
MKAVIFDLDNTLVDFSKLREMSRKAAMDAMRDAGLKISIKKADQILTRLEMKYGTEYGELFQLFLKEVMGKIDWKILANAINAYRKMRSSFLEPYPGVVSTLIKLKQMNLKLAIVSDAPRLRGWLRLAAMNLEPFFDVVVFHDDTGVLKPNKKTFMKALNKMKVKPEECLMVGDHYQRDMVGAKKIGMKTCHARYGYIPGWSGNVVKNFKPDYVIDSIEELLEIL